MAGSSINVNVDSSISGFNETEKGALKVTSALELLQKRIEKLVPEYKKFLQLSDKVFPLLQVEGFEDYDTRKKEKDYSHKRNKQEEKVSKYINENQNLWENLSKEDRGKLFAWGQKNLYNPGKNPSGSMKANPFEHVDIDPNLLIKSFIGKLNPEVFYRNFFNKNSNSDVPLIPKSELDAIIEKNRAEALAAKGGKRNSTEDDFEMIDASLVELNNSIHSVSNSFKNMEKTSAGEITSHNESTSVTDLSNAIKESVKNAVNSEVKSNSFNSQDIDQSLRNKYMVDSSDDFKESIEDQIAPPAKETGEAVKDLGNATKEAVNIINEAAGKASGKETSRRINGQVFKPSDLDDPILGKAIKQALQGNNAYGRNVRVAEGNLQISRNEEPFKIAKMAMQVTNKGLGGGSGNAYVNNIFKAFGSQITKSFNNGFKNLNFGKLLEDAYVQRRKSKKQDSVLKNFGLENDQLFATDTLFNKEDFKKVLEGTDAFKNFAAQLKEDLGEAGEALSDDDIYEQFKNGKQSRQTLIENLSGNDREMLGDYVKGITASKKDRKDLLKSLSSDSKDRARLIGGIAGAGGEGAKALGSVAGKAVAPIAFIQGLGTAGKALLKFANSTIQAYEGIQKLQTQLSVVFATTTQANATFTEIAEYAKKSPFGVEQTTQEAILLKQSGVYSSELMDTIKRIGDLSSGSAEKMKSISEVYARVMSSTTVTARDMRQLANAGVASYSALSKATGTDKSLIRAQLQSGKITSQDFKAMVKELTDEGGMFYGATERGARTIAARKQNLSDAKQLATSEIGRFFANLGGNTTQDSYYGKILTLMENIYSGVEEMVKSQNDKKEAEAVENYVKELQQKYNKQAELISKGKDTTKVDQDIEKLESLIRSQQGASSAAGVNVYERAVKEVNKSLAKYGKDMSWLNEKVPNKETLTRLRTENRGYSTSELETLGLDSAESLFQNGDFFTNLSLILTHSIDNLFKKATEAGQKGADMLDAAINEIDTALDDVENTQNRLQDLSAAQTRMSSARRDWNQNSPVAQMMLKDAQAQRDDYLKQRITYFEGKTLDKETGKYDLSKLGINEFAEAAKMITTEVRKLDLDMENGHIWSAEANKGRGGVSEAGVETLGILKENLEEVYATLLNDGGEDLVGRTGMKEFESLISMLGQDVSKFDKDKLEILMKLLDKVNESSEKAAETQGEKGENYRNILQAAQTETVRDTSNAKYLNKRKQAVLWAQILSQTTGISAERVQGVGAATAMNAYTTNFAQREMFSKLGKALLSNGSSLKDLSNVLKANHTGKDGYGHDLYNWQGATAAAEQMAAKQSLETQGALIDAYQQQIDVLTDLEMSGIATRDQWDNVGALAAQLGTGFSLAAEQMADGSYRFTEATIQAAEEMKAALNAKKFVQELNYILRNAREKINEETRNSQFIISGLSGNINLGGGLNTEQTQKVVNDAISVALNKTLDTSPDVFDQLGISKNGMLNLSDKNLQDLQKFLNNQSLQDGNNYQIVNKTTSKAVGEWVDAAKDVQTIMSKLGMKAGDLIPGKRGDASNRWWSEYKEIEDRNVRNRQKGLPTEELKNFDDWQEKQIATLRKQLEGQLEKANIRYVINGQSIKAEKWNQTETNTVTNTEVIRTDELGQQTKVDLKDFNVNLQKLQEAIRKGTATEEERTQYIETMLSLDGSLSKEISELNLSVKKNTEVTNKLNKTVETSKALDVLKEYRQMSGYQGEDIRKTYEERDYASMPEYAPLRMNVNSTAKAQALELMGFPSDANWKDVMRRTSQQYIPQNIRDTLTKEGVNALNETQKTSLKDSQEYLGKFLYENNKRMLLNTGSEEDITKKKVLKGRLQELLGEQEDGTMGYENIENYAEALKLLEESGVSSIDALTEAWSRNTAAMMEGNLALKEAGENMKNSLKDSGLNAILTTTQLIGENWYKISNELMTQEDALDSIKRSLAGQAAELMNNISKEAVIAGLRLIGAGAMSSPVGWGMIAAGAGLIAVGGMAGIAGGLLKGYSEDSESNKTDQEINRLEALRDNLADLLKQAKADAEYYEVNLRAKKAFATNENVSATKVTRTNDMILSPSGVFSTHPDDYIMAMKDPASLMGNGSPIVNFSIINNSGANLNVESSKTTQDGNKIDIEVVVNGIVQKGMVSGEYDNAFSAMQARNEGVKTSA